MRMAKKARLAMFMAVLIGVGAGLGGGTNVNAQVASKAAPAASTQRHLMWTELVPKGWDPMAEFRERFKDPKLPMMDDADPKVLQMMKDLREVWDQAPVNMEMDGATGKLPGYVVPLDDSRKGMKEFLLVPYYGACIHSPPPPANQIVLVRSEKPIKGFQSMDTVWVHGVLKAARGDSAMGVSGWRLDALKVERYERPPVQPAR
jgi:hypothetical protein